MERIDRLPALAKSIAARRHIQAGNVLRGKVERLLDQRGRYTNAIAEVSLKASREPVFKGRRSNPQRRDQLGKPLSPGW